MTEQRPGADLPNANQAQLQSLLLMTDAVTAEGLVEQVKAAAAKFDRHEAEDALGRLADLGLVRIAAHEEGRPEYVRTTLGREYAAAFLAAESPTSRQLAELEQLRTDFVATVAHELKTPLTAIRTCIGLLIDTDAGVDPALRRRLLDRVSASAEGMQRLIEALLDLARARGRGLPLEPRWINANEVAREAIALVAPLLEDRQQVVRLAVAEPSPNLYGDRPRLVQALGNVLSNAQRFSPVGAMIAVVVRPVDDGVAWDVIDQGPGISEADQRHLFERFFRGRSDVEGGTGLRLPIALATVQAHRGTIGVSSELGAGSTFTITVPINQRWASTGDRA